MTDSETTMEATRPSRLRGLVGGSAAAIGIKLSGAGLNFLMFVAAAIVTDPREFGLFSTTFAAASLVSFVNIVGQQSVVLRFWPQHAGSSDMRLAHALLRRSASVVGIGLALGAAGFVLLSLLPLDASIPEWTGLCLGAAALSVALGWSEFMSSVMRAKDALLQALLPRDVAWRVLAIAGFFAAWWAWGDLSGTLVTAICAGTLLACIAGQTVRLLADTWRAERRPLDPAEKREFNSVTLGLWGVNAVPPALGQVNTLIVAGILGAETAGAIFVAERTARLIDLPLNGINQVLAPHISRNFYKHGAASVQRPASLAALAAFVLALGSMAFFALFGMQLLGLFDAAYVNRTNWTMLLIFGLSSTVAAACGPTALLLQLTGHQNALLRIFTLVSAAGIPLIALAAWSLGPIGAAAAISAVMIVANLWPLAIAFRSLRINPTVFGVRRKPA